VGLLNLRQCRAAVRVSSDPPEPLARRSPTNHRDGMAYAEVPSFAMPSAKKWPRKSWGYIIWLLFGSDRSGHRSAAI